MTIQKAAAAGLSCLAIAFATAAENDRRPDISGVWLAYGTSAGGGAELSERGRALVDGFYATTIACISYGHRPRT
jgi:hypothetical protein